MDLVPLGVPAIPVLCSVGFPSQMLYLQEKNYKGKRAVGKANKGINVEKIIIG